MRVLVTFALETEFAPWRALRKFRPWAWGAARAYQTMVGAADVGVILTGAGPKQAALQVAMLEKGQLDEAGFLISAGLAGGLRAGYEIGQVLAARTVVAERLPLGASAGGVDSSSALVLVAEACGATAVERFYTAERVIARAEAKRSLTSSADAVEMESFQILWKAQAESIPAVAIRAISDTVDEDLPLDMNEIFTTEGEVSIPRVLGQLAMRPQSLPGLVRLGRKSKQAAESLALFLDRYIMACSERVLGLEMKKKAVIGAVPQ